MTTAPAPSPAPRPVLLFDAECGFCRRVVRLLLRLDPGARLAFAPLQGPPAREFLRAQRLPPDAGDSLVFIPDWHRPTPGAYQLRSDGVLRALATLGGPWRILSWLRLIPRPLRDTLYRTVARHRHALGGDPAPWPPPHAVRSRRFLPEAGEEIPATGACPRAGNHP